MSEPTVIELFKRFPPDLLDRQVSEIHLAHVAMEIVQWEDMASLFGISQAQLEEIRRNDEGRYGLQKQNMLWKWREMKGREATYRQLIIVFSCLKKHNLVDVLERLLLPQPKAQETTTNVLDSFKGYLIDCYEQIPHPSRNWWPFSCNATYVDLPLFQIPLNQDEFGGEVSSPMPINIDNLFYSSHKAKRKFVLVEGVAGSGKTTLTWRACQKWAQGLIFKQFSLLIYLSLRDPELRSAKSLADLIPHPSSDMREAVAKAIAECQGKKICFLLDGWDEAIPELKEFICSLIAGRTSRTRLPQCSFIVTSRPVASGVLYSYTTSRVVIGRLDRTHVNNLINASFRDAPDPEGGEELIELLNQNPQLAGICNLPINVAIIVHLFQCGHRNLPETRTELFKVLVCNLLIRHMQLRTNHGLQELRELEDLPEDVLMSLQVVSLLAFESIKHYRGVFDSSALRQLGITSPLNALGLLQARQQLTAFGPSTGFSFLHYSVQEFLGAWHMSRLSSEDQVKSVSEILHSRPLSPVLSFFAGLTRLSNPSVRDVLFEVTKHPLGTNTIMSNKPRTPGEDRRRLALALLNCIYEAQDPSLCELVQPPFANPLGQSTSSKYECWISFSFLGLEPNDCLSIGYFMANQTKFPVFVNLKRSFISESGVEAIMKHLKIATVPNLNTHNVNFGGNFLSTRSMRLIGSMMNKLSCLSYLSLTYSWQPSDVSANLTSLIQGLCRRTLPIDIEIAANHITTDHTHLLVLLITACRHIDLLALGMNNIGGGMALIAAALKVSTSIFRLNLDNCNIGDVALTQLSTALQTREFISCILLNRNPFSSEALMSFLESQSKSMLLRFEIGRPLNKQEEAVLDRVNRTRCAHFLPVIRVDRSLTQAMALSANTHKTVTSLSPQVVSRRFTPHFD